MTAANARGLLFIIAVDVLMMPVLPVVFLPASFVIVSAVLVLQWRNDGLHLNSRVRLFVVVLLATLVLSYFTKPSTVPINNAVFATFINTQQEDTKRVMHLVLAVAFYAVVRHLLRIGGVVPTIRTVRLVVVAALLSCGLMFFLFVAHVDSYASVRNLLFGTDVDLRGIGELQSAGYTNRFGYVLLDPNNAAYYMLALAMFALHNLKLPGVLKGYCVLLIVAVPFATRSLGGLVAATLCLVASGLAFLAAKRSVRSIGIRIGAPLALIGLVLVAYFFDQGLLEQLIRSQSDVFARWESNTADSRVSNWITLLMGPLPPIIGWSYVMVVNDHWFNPHSDHFRVLYAYGFVAYGCVAAEAAFGHYWHRRFLFLIPIAAAFSLNSFLDESRFLLSGAILLAFSKVAAPADAGVATWATSGSTKIGLVPSPAKCAR